MLRREAILIGKAKGFYDIEQAGRDKLGRTWKKWDWAGDELCNRELAW
jgi:hypothetical protein